MKICAWLEGELTADDVLADTLLPDDLDGPEPRERARRGHQHELPPAGAGLLFLQLNLGVWISVVAQRIQRALAGGELELAIERPIGLQRESLEQRLAPILRDDVEPLQLDRSDAHRLAFGDVDGDIDLLLRLVQLDVERGHARIGKTAVAVERLDALEIRLEGAPVEVALPAPRDPRSLSLSAARCAERSCRPARRR